jgi:hypothetical protein
VGRTTIVTVLSLLALAAIVVYSSMGLTTHRCEVCISFDGRQACRTVEGGSEDEAMAGATTNACALVASGVTETMRCQRTPPARSTCEALP